MDKIIYRTRPRLFIFGMTFMGFVFFGLLLLLILPSIQDDYNLLFLILLVFFAFLSLTSLFYFLSTKTIKITKDKVIISYLFLPIKRILNLTEIRSMEQRTKEIKAVYGASWNPSYIYTEIKTYINLIDNTQIKLNTIGKIEFDEFYKIYFKLKRGEGKIKEPKKYFLLYLLDSLDGLLWIIILLISTIGLGYEICTRQ